MRGLPRSSFGQPKFLPRVHLSTVGRPTTSYQPRVKIRSARWVKIRSAPTALVVHRAQFEAIVRSVWLTYVASDADIAKLTAELDLESEQAAKNVAQTQRMMEAIAKSAPPQAHEALARFKENSWKALNSYAHAGIHPLRRHAEGYPAALAYAVLCNANGLALFSGMQAVVLSGAQPLQRRVIDLAAKYPSCAPPTK